jgi:hypothetical protein
MFMQPNSTSH